MGKKWHTNKTIPKAYKEFIAITKLNGVLNFEIEMILQNDFNKNIICESWWKTVLLWQYTDNLFKKELEQLQENKP